MKTRILLFIALVVSFASHAQTGTLILESPNLGNWHGGTEVRCTEDSNWFVSFHAESATKMIFMLFDQGGTCRRMEIPSNIIVRDFDIRGDMVYFCGNMNGTGVFGYFKIADFWNPTGSLLYDNLPSVDFAAKICTYKDPNDGQTVVVIEGCKLTPGGTMQYKEVYLYKISGSNYDGYYCDSNHLSTINRFAVTDITVTDNYIVAAGTRQQGTISELVLSMVYKGNLSQYQYAFITEPDLNAGALIEKLNGDQVALVDEVYDPTTLTFSDRIRTIDLPSHSVILAQEIALPEKTAPNSLLYVKPTGKLMMKQVTMQGNTYQDYIYKVDPYNNSYVSDIVYELDNWYASMDQVGTRRLITVAEKNTVNTNHRFLICDIPTMTQTQCLQSLQFKVIPKDPELFSFNPDNLIYKNNTFSSLPFSCIDGSISVVCP